jgi:hypothetical protein
MRSPAGTKARDLARRTLRIEALAQLVAALAIASLLAPTSASADETVVACNYEPNHVFGSVQADGINVDDYCPLGPLELSTVGASIKQGVGALWQTVAPPGLLISGVHVDLASNYVNDGTAGQYGGDFYWTGGSSNIVPGETSAGFPGLSSPDFGFLLVCGKPTCDQGGAFISAYEIALDVSETSGPALSSFSGLWQAMGWVRGTWPLAFSGDSPSGMCSLEAEFAGQPLPGTVASPDESEWHECSTAPIDDPVSTVAYPQGPDSLQVGGTDAAGAPASLTKTIYVDNQTPTIALSGPADAPATAGTQYLTATATAGPSGVAGMSCSVDGAPSQWYPTATTQIPVSGIGEHQVRCYSVNNAVDATGARGTSIAQTFSMKIGTPTVAAVAFSTLVDKLKCHSSVQRVRIPARWVTVRVHGQAVRVREPARRVRVRITKCHARTARRRIAVWATVRRHGHEVHILEHKTVRVLLEPHVVNKTKRIVGYGRTTTVDGWLGTTSGIALGGQTVDVMTAPNDGQGDFQLAAVVTSAPNGGWSAQLPPGPSRLVEASYAGSATTEAAVSAPVSVAVPAKVELLRVSPRRVSWGGTVRLVGQLEGGYLPAGGALVRLRIGLGSAMTTYGVQTHVSGGGRFSTRYTFGEGDPSFHRTYWFELATLPIGDYPYAPARSRRVYVTVGGNPR